MSKKRIFIFFGLLFICYLTILIITEGTTENPIISLTVRTLSDIIGAGITVYLFLFYKKVVLKIDLPKRIETWGLINFTMIIFALIAALYKK